MKLEDQGKRPIHRFGKDTVKGRYRIKLLGKTEWYKNKTEEKTSGTWEEPRHREEGNRSVRRNQHQDPTAVFFVDRTPEGGLIKALRETEINMQTVTNRKIKISRTCRNTGEIPDLESRPLGWSGMLGR